MKKDDVICLDTQKTRVENDLDVLYGKIMICLDDIMDLCGLENDFIDKKLYNDEVTQTDLDFKLMQLISVIKGYED